jgi:hypothetical protein
LKIKLKSGALQFAIYTAAIVALLLLGLILYLHTFKTLQQSTEISTDNIKASHVGFSEAFEENNISSDTVTISNFINPSQKVKSVSSFWGIFQKTSVTAKNRNKVFQKSALLGCTFLTKDRISVYLENTNKPLIVVGNTKIEGNVMIPDQGVQPGYIAGNAYMGNELIYGNIGFSSKNLPKLNKSLSKSLEELESSSATLYSNFVLDQNAQNINSFLSETKVFYNKNSFSITQDIVGNYIIKSDNTITIKATSKLKDIIIIAPKIIVEDGVIGNFQAIAFNGIQVGKNVKLSYPSALVIHEQNVLSDDSMLFIDSSSVIKGVLMFVSKKDLLNSFATHIKVSEETKIVGEIYCEGNLELNGSVWGSVYTHQFLTNTAGTIFVNHLYNAEISSDEFPCFYSGILFENQTKNIMKWLY